MRRQERRRLRIRTWLSRVLTAALVLICLFLLFVGYGLVGNRWYHVLAIEGASMEPSIHWGDLLVITKPPNELEPGMIVTMNVDGQLVTHRVVGVDPLVTKGDANTLQDQWREDQVRVVGIVRFRIPKMGWGLQRLNLGSLGSSDALLRSRDTVAGSINATGTFGAEEGKQATERALPATLEAPASDTLQDSEGETFSTLPAEQNPSSSIENESATTTEPMTTTTSASATAAENAVDIEETLTTISTPPAVP